MFDEKSPEYDGSANAPSMTPNQKMLADVFGYFNKVSCSVAQENIKIRVEKPNGMKTYLRTKKQKEDKEERILSPEECRALQEETMYNTELIPAGNATEILRTLLRFVTANDTFQKQMEVCVGEALNVANKKASATKFIEDSSMGGMN